MKTTGLGRAQCKRVPPNSWACTESQNTMVHRVSLEWTLWNICFQQKSVCHNKLLNSIDSPQTKTGNVSDMVTHFYFLRTRYKRAVSSLGWRATIKNSLPSWTWRWPPRWGCSPPQWTTPAGASRRCRWHQTSRWRRKLASPPPWLSWQHPVRRCCWLLCQKNWLRWFPWLPFSAFGNKYSFPQYFWQRSTYILLPVCHFSHNPETAWSVGPCSFVSLFTFVPWWLLEASHCRIPNSLNNVAFL